MTEHEYDVVESGIAVLAGADEQSTDATTVHGVAIGEDDITEGMSGKRTRWPPEVLRAGAEKLIGKPIVTDHPGAEKTDEGVRVDGPPPLEAKVGEVTDARYVEGRGLVWEGSVADPEAAQQIERGLADVSPIVAREIRPVESDDGGELFEATSIQAFRDLGLVSSGAAPSNSVATGTAALWADALAAAWEADADGDGDTGSDDPAGASSSGRDTDDPTDTQDSDMGDNDPDLTDDERALLDAVEDPVDAREALADLHGFEEPHTMEQPEFEAMRSELNTVREMYAEALAERWGTDPEKLVERFDVDALREEFEDDEGNLDVDALVQSPETGEPDEDDDPDNVDALADLDEETRDEVEAAKSRFEYWDGKNDTIADAEKQTVVEALGVDSFDDVDLEAI